jgi:hypothetical protein
MTGELRIVNNSSDTGDDALFYIENQSSAD